MMNDLKISNVGLGHILLNEKLKVPIYQRPYSWKDEQVRQLLEDIARAKKRQRKGATSNYFLGSIVVIPRQESDRIEIVDGQQRLATTSIIITAIRDWHKSINDSAAVSEYEKYLQWMDLKTRLWHPRLSLNETDNECYRKCILREPNSRKIDKTQFKDTSHKRLLRAYTIARSYFENIAKQGTRQDTLDEFAEWIDYLRYNAQVIQVTVDNDAEAFTVFESLNDRGLDLTEADLLKNYLFGLAGPDNLDTVRREWSEMNGAIKTTGSKDRTVDFIRQFWGSKYGIIRRSDLFADIRAEIFDAAKGVALAKDLSESAVTYSAILNTDHNLWDSLGTKARNAARAIRTMGGDRLRPLLMSIIDTFNPAQATKAICYLESALVRLAVAGERFGAVEKTVFAVAAEVRNKTIKSATAMAAKLKDIVPSNSVFRSSFLSHRVSKARLARYLLQALDDAATCAAERKVLPDEEEFDLEHIIPQKDREKWRHLSTEKADDLCYRIGNMTLMRRMDNGIARGNSYSDKAVLLAKTTEYKLTREIPEKWPGPEWGEKQVNERQEELAGIALLAWPDKPV